MAELKTTPDTKVKQIAKLELLQDLLLDDYLEMLRNRTLTATDRSNLIRWLMANGMDLDAKHIPQDLKSKLTENVSFDDDIEGDIPARLRAI